MSWSPSATAIARQSGLLLAIIRARFFLHADTMVGARDMVVIVVAVVVASVVVVVVVGVVVVVEVVGVGCVTPSWM